MVLLLQGKDLKGKEVRIALHASPASFPDGNEGARTAHAIAAGNEIEFRVPDLPPGRYAASAFVDRNGNASLDRNFIGIPAEPYRFSRDARRLMGPPDFAEAAFEIGDADLTQSLILR